MASPVGTLRGRARPSIRQGCPAAARESPGGRIPDMDQAEGVLVADRNYGVNLRDCTRRRRGAHRPNNSSRRFEIARILVHG
jgi:hypothetical protein